MNKIDNRHLHNRSRFYCQKRMAEFVIGSNNWRQRAYYSFFLLLLIEIEYFTETDFENNSDSETLTYFVLMSDMIQDKFDKLVMIWFEDVLKREVSFKEINAIISEARQDFLNFLKNYTLPEYDAPVLPYRRVLSYNEYEEIWGKFGSLWLPRKAKSYTDLYYSNEYSVKSIANRLQEIGVKRLLNLGLAINYEIDITLMDDMFGCDDSYWTPKTLDWYIWTGGHGYTEVAGSPIRKIMRHSVADLMSKNFKAHIT